MTTTIPPRVHVAGPMVELVQRCSVCGYALCDYSNTWSPLGTSAPRGWREGALVAVLDGSKWLANEGEASPDRRCRPAVTA
jgi:hypothetical protein